MEDTCCDICFEEYNDKKVLPKVIKCGHSLCVDCLKQLLSAGQVKCPRCAKRFSAHSADDFPTNFSLLSLSESFKKIHCTQIAIKSDISMMKSRIVANKNVLSKVMDINQGYSVFLEGSQHQLEELENSNKTEVNMTESVRILKELKKNLYTVESNILTIQSTLTATMKFADGVTPYAYLKEIYKKVKNSESVYAVHYVNGRPKYGKISSHGNMLLFHTLCLPDIKESAEIVKFQDLKKCIDKNFRTFLMIYSNANGIRQMVKIEMLSSSLGPQFIKLCTGELGSSYKDAKFSKGEDKDQYAQSILKIHGHVTNECQEPGAVDYCISSDVDLQYPHHKIVVQASGDGSFSLYHNKSKYNYKNVVGTVEDPSNLNQVISYDGVAYLEVVDCGIAFIL